MGADEEISETANCEKLRCEIFCQALLGNEIKSLTEILLTNLNV